MILSRQKTDKVYPPQNQVKNCPERKMENETQVDKPLDSKVELEKHLPEWFVLLRKLVAEHLNTKEEINSEAKNDEPARA